MNSGSKNTAKYGERAAPLATGPRRTYELAGLALILLTTFLVYQPALHGGLLVDDEGNITPPNLRPVSGLYHIWCDPTVTAQYYPILHTAFWLEHRLWGDSLVGYHLVTLLWHEISVVLLYFLLQRLKVPGALLAAAIFALHPVMVESVAWMCEQKNTLSTVFYLSAMLMYLKFDASRRRASYFTALGLFALALLAKTITVTLPAALLVIFWWQRGRVDWRRDVLPLLPFFVLAAASGLMTVWVERTYFHGEEAGFSLSIAQRFLLAGRAIWFYLGKLAWPANLMFTYPRWTIDPTQWWQWIFPIAVLVTTLALWAIRKRWRSPLASWLLFCGTLLPTLGFANVYMFVITFVADHFQYLASLGVIVLAASAAASGLARLPQPARRAGIALCILLVATLAGLSRQQSRIYGDVVTFYETALKDNPNSWLAHNNLGLALYREGKPLEASEHYRAALSIKPNFSLAHRNLGGVFADHGHLSEAMDEFRAALAINRDDPESLNGLGLALIQIGRAAEAIEPLQRAIRLQPDYAVAHNNLGIALNMKGEVANAIVEFQRSLKINSDYAYAHNSWGNALYGIGEKLPAIEHFKQAVRIDPNDASAHYNLASVLAEVGQTGEAISHFQQAIHVRPGFMPAYVSLAQALASANRTNEALAAAEKGIESAKSTNQTAAAEQLEEWLKHYQTELQRVADPASLKSFPPVATPNERRP